MKISKYLLGSLMKNEITALPLTAEETIGFPEGYTFTQREWGAVYYKIFSTEKIFSDATQQCQRDGGTLPLPKSG